MFKVGDKIRGKKGQNKYGVTDQKMTLAEVVGLDADFMKVIVIDHPESKYVHMDFIVTNSEGYFELVEEAESNQNVVQEVNENVTFEVGDEVEAFGLKGEVIRIVDGIEYPIEVKYEDRETIDTFTLNGNFHDYHKKPSLILIKKKPKKEVEKVKYVLVNDKGGIITGSFDSIQELDKSKPNKPKDSVIAELHYTVLE